MRFAAAEASAWLTDRVGRSTTLVWQPDPEARPIAADRGGLAGEHLSLADAGLGPDATHLLPPQMNGSPDPHPGPLNVVRFRPNVVVDGDDPFDEDR